MKIAVSNDHAGFVLKEKVHSKKKAIKCSTSGLTTKNLMTCPFMSILPLWLWRKEKADRGIFVDGVAYGSALIANKICGVYAAVCPDPFGAKLARPLSDINVLCLGRKIIGSALALEIVAAWMTIDYLSDIEKYANRVDKVKKIAEKHLKNWVKSRTSQS